MHILLVEDNADDVTFVRRLVRRSDVAISLAVASDGQDALDYLLRRGRHADRPSASTPKLILLDISLPGMEGIEVLRRLKADSKLGEIPVVMLTGSDDDRHVREAQELGAHSHIVKPMSARDFAWIAGSIRNYWVRIEKLGPRAADQGAHARCSP